MTTVGLRSPLGSLWQSSKSYYAVESLFFAFISLSKNKYEVSDGNAQHALIFRVDFLAFIGSLTRCCDVVFGRFRQLDDVHSTIVCLRFRRKWPKPPNMKSLPNAIIKFDWTDWIEPTRLSSISIFLFAIWANLLFLSNRSGVMMPESLAPMPTGETNNLALDLS